MHGVVGVHRNMSIFNCKVVSFVATFVATFWLAFGNITYRGNKTFGYMPSRVLEAFLDGRDEGISQ